MTRTGPPRICLVLPGSLASTPRMLKAADALHQAGYAVRVVSSGVVPWNLEADHELMRSRTWSWSPVYYDRRGHTGRWLATWLRQRQARTLIRALGTERAPLDRVAAAQCRPHAALLAAVLARPADLVYGGGGGGLAVAALAARRLGAAYALDLEDDHAATQEEGPAGERERALVLAIEREVLAEAAFLTAGGPLIAQAYGHRWGVEATVLHNVFPLPAQPPPRDAPANGRLRLYWMSQLVGPGRGLEEAILGAGRSGLAGEIVLQGNAHPRYLAGLRELAARAAPRFVLRHLAPVASPEDACLHEGYHVGLALEGHGPPAKAIAASNKLFAYLRAGLAVIATDTPGQREVAADLGPALRLHRPGDATALAADLAALGDPTRLTLARQAAWEAARRRWHWEHPLERGALLALVRRTLGEPGA